MKIAFDVDDVCADLHPAWLGQLNAVAGTSHTPEDFTQWDFWRDFGWTEDFIYTHLTPELYKSVQPCPGALEVVNAVRQLGHSVVFVTSCKDAETWLAKSTWLVKFGFLQSRDQAFPVGKWASYHTKAEVAKIHQLDVLVDDCIANVEEWPGVAYLLTKPHNRQHVCARKRLRKLSDLLLEIKYLKQPPGTIVEYEGSFPPVAYADKPTNPKDALGAMKLPLHLVSGIVKAYQAIAHWLGNVKYGSWNYAAKGARASVYIAALYRHIDRWVLGETNDPVDGTPHLANALACINILIECSERGNLVDDRPPSHDLSELYARLEKLQADIAERYKDKQPKHYTIADSVETV